MHHEGVGIDKLGANDTKATQSLPSGRDLIKGIAIIWGAGICVITISVIPALKRGPEQFEMSPLNMLFITLFCSIVTFVISWYFVCRKYHRGLVEGFALHKPNKRVIVLSVAIGVAAAVIGGSLIERYAAGESFMAKFAATPGGLAALIIMAVVMPPFEEAYYRGFIFPIIERRAGAALAIVVVVIWFGAAHASQLSGDWIGVPIIAVMGLIYTLQRYVHKSLVPPILTHWTYNTVLAVVSLIQALQ